MNHEQDLDSDRQAHLSAKQRLEEAIKHYLEVCQRADENRLRNGVLTAWYLVTEEQDPISGEGANVRVVRDHQSPSTTMGLIVYSDEWYRDKVRSR